MIFFFSPSFSLSAHRDRTTNRFAPIVRVNNDVSRDRRLEMTASGPGPSHGKFVNYLNRFLLLGLFRFITVRVGSVRTNGDAGRRFVSPVVSSFGRGGNRRPTVYFRGELYDFVELIFI